MIARISLKRVSQNVSTPLLVLPNTTLTKTLMVYIQTIRVLNSLPSTWKGMNPLRSTGQQAVTHVIFDMDGLLLDTEIIYTRVQEQIAARFGKKFTWELKAKMMGQKALDAAKIFVQELDISDKMSAEECLETREALLDELFPEAEFLPGALELLNHLKRHSVPCALATSSHRRHFDLKTSKHRENFEEFFGDIIITGDMVERGKPHPDIFLDAMQLFTPVPDPKTCLVFEDAPSGVQAAKRAGMHCVMVPDVNLSGDEYIRGADVVIQSLRDAPLEMFGLPALQTCHDSSNKGFS